jgi:hypothetical protein
MKTNHHFSKALGFVFTCLLFFTSPAKADCGGSLQSAYCSDVRITLLYVDANYHAYITINGNISALPCTAGGAYSSSQMILRTLKHFMPPFWQRI